MKKHLFSNFAVTMLMAFLASFTLSSCSEEIVVEDKQEVQQEEVLDIPEGAVVFSTTADDATRTSMGLDAKFYWTNDNVIWVDVDNDRTFSLGSDGMLTSDDKSIARFFFSDFPEVSEREPKYNLIYTGTKTSEELRKKVTIPANQSQTDPNDGTVIGKNGDCATAVATRNAKGQYTFMLDHKAHYLIFQPYKDVAIPHYPDNTDDPDKHKAWKLKKIEIISLDDETLSGTFNFATTYEDFSEAGLEVSSATGGSNTVTISTGAAGGVELQRKADDNDAWYAVIAPATDGEHWLRIKYTINPDAKVNYYNDVYEEEIVIVKDVKIASAPNKVTKIKHKMMAVRVPSDEFYQWDAVKRYWEGIPYEPINQRATYYGQTGPGYDPDNINPDSKTPYTTNPAAGRAAINPPCSDLPNVNAMTWYAMAGDARWDNEYPWRFDDDFNHIYTKGTWFLKWEHIVTENVTRCPELETTTKANCPKSFIGTIDVYNNDGSIKEENRVYDGTDYRSTTFKDNAGVTDNTRFQPRFPGYKTNGRPKDISRYFILPTNGHVADGKLATGGDIHGCYWSSSAVPGTNRAYIMELKSFSLQVRQENGNITQGRSALDWWE